MEEKRTQTAEEQLQVSEIFLSVQGEGVHSGTPSVFLRTYRCNLSCTWCDTKYTWLDQDKSKPGFDYSPMSLSAVMERISSYGCKHLVVTGGEPLLHQRALSGLLASLKREGFFVEVETNGTVAPTEEFVGLVDCFNVSPKISNSKVKEKARVRPDAIRALVGSGKAWFKFVICKEDDVAEVEDVVSKAAIPRERVMLMPEGTDASTMLKRGLWLADICKRRNFRFAPRLQILLYGNTRGT